MENNSNSPSMWANWNYRPLSSRLSRADMQIHGENVGRTGNLPSSRNHTPLEDRYSHRLKYRSCPFPFEASIRNTV